MIDAIEALTLQLGDLSRFLLGRLRPRRIVTLHHLACSGGTIMTKCLAAMNSALVLSEIHPDRPMGDKYHPLSQLMAGYGAELTKAQARVIRGHFRREIQIAFCVARSRDRTLVVRDHAHVDFAWNKAQASRLFDRLSPDFAITPIVTTRDPREVWISLKREGWFEGTPDELCQAQLNLLLAFPEAPVFQYEDFVKEPNQTIEALCKCAGIPFEADFMDRLPRVTHMTGDSGRSADIIAPRPPKELDPADAEAFRNSPAYAALMSHLDARSPGQ